jgi:hypothetical protein
MPYLLEKLQAHASYDQQRRPELLLLIGFPVICDNHAGILAVNPHEIRMHEAQDITTMTEKIPMNFIMRAGVERWQILGCSYESQACKVLSAISNPGRYYAVLTHNANLL